MVYAGKDATGSGSAGETKAKTYAIQQNEEWGEVQLADLFTVMVRSAEKKRNSGKPESISVSLPQNRQR